MISLYHGGSDIIKSPEIRKPNRTLDFGKGFYLTSSESQAKDWVIRRIQNDRIGSGYVNEYAIDIDSLASTLNIKSFDSPDDEWLDFVMNNRQDPDFEHDFDIVIGPVADDRVYTAFALFEGGTISREGLIAELRTYRLVDQFLFHTNKALAYLNFVDAKRINL